MSNGKYCGDSDYFPLAGSTVIEIVKDQATNGHGRYFKKVIRTNKDVQEIWRVIPPLVIFLLTLVIISPSSVDLDMTGQKEMWL